MTSQILIRVDKDTKERFERIARQEKKSTSQKLRELMTHYVREHDISGYIDDLWERTGADLKAKGISPASIDRAIEKVRSGGK